MDVCLKSRTMGTHICLNLEKCSMSCGVFVSKSGTAGRPIHSYKGPSENPFSISEWSQNINTSSELIIDFNCKTNRSGWFMIFHLIINSNICIYIYISYIHIHVCIYIYINIWCIYIVYIYIVLLKTRQSRCLNDVSWPSTTIGDYRQPLWQPRCRHHFQWPASSSPRDEGRAWPVHLIKISCFWVIAVTPQRKY